MNIIKFIQFFQLTKNSKHLNFFLLFLANANFNPDFHKRITLGGFQITSTCPDKSMAQTDISFCRPQIAVLDKPQMGLKLMHCTHTHRSSSLLILYDCEKAQANDKTV